MGFRLLLSTSGASVASFAIAIASLPVIVPASTASAQERPEVHADFAFGTLPFDQQANELLSEEETRRLIVALSRGWSVEKYVKETGTRELSVLTLMDDLEDEGLIRGDSDYDMRPAFPVFREEDLGEVAPLVDKIALGLSDLIEEHWSDVEQMAMSLDAGETFPREEMYYRIVVGGVLFGGMVDVLNDDKTLVPAPRPRRGRSGAFYAWLTEADADADASSAPLVYHVVQVGRHAIHSIGPLPPDESRVEIAALGQTDPVFEDEDARRWRIFSSVFSRDYLLPYLKAQRQELLDVAAQLQVSRYAAFAEFVAWTYLSSASEAARILTESGRIDGPETSLRYALRMDR